MKNLIVFIMLILVLCSCSDLGQEVIYFKNNEYIGFNDADTSISKQECIDRGYLILDGIMIEDNYDKVQDFIDTSERGDTYRLRIAMFDKEELFYIDLIYCDGGYYCYYMDEDSYPAEPYAELLVLEGKFGMPVQEYKMVVISDNPSLTFDEVNEAMFSSSMPFSESVGRHRIVLFRY